MVIQHKCPDCAADMIFDAETGLLTCEYCGRTDNIETLKNPINTEKNTDQETPPQEPKSHEDKTTYNMFEDDTAVEYLCNNCGAVIITGPDTTATTCSYCGAPMLMGDRLSGTLAPAKIIPFHITKKKAQQAFKKWCKHGLLTPFGFTNHKRVDSIVGIYIPFWLFDINARGEIHAECKKVSHYPAGSYDITQTDYYDCYRKVDLYYSRIPCDASIKMDDTIMDKLEPYYYSELKTFNTPYLAGFLAEKYNYTDKDLFERVRDRVESYTKEYTKDTIQGYSSVQIQNSTLNIGQLLAHYTLLPVWMINYTYNNVLYTFAMNGQTGKVIGKPPLSKYKISAWIGGITGGIFLIARIITILMGGNIL